MKCSVAFLLCLLTIIPGFAQQKNTPAFSGTWVCTDNRDVIQLKFSDGQHVEAQFGSAQPDGKSCTYTVSTSNNEVKLTIKPVDQSKQDSWVLTLTKINEELYTLKRMTHIYSDGRPDEEELVDNMNCKLKKKEN